MVRYEKAVARALDGAPPKIALGVRKWAVAASRRIRMRNIALKRLSTEDNERRYCARLAHKMEEIMGDRKDLQSRSAVWKSAYGAVINELRAASRHNLRMMEESLKCEE